MKSTKKIGKFVRITGEVQGVGYRMWTKREASGMGLKGWVRNRSDGSVEALFSGPDFMVDTMLQHCRQGPPGSIVKEVQFKSAPPQESPGFSILDTV